jgi:hypothetical protein
VFGVTSGHANFEGITVWKVYVHVLFPLKKVIF